MPLNLDNGCMFCGGKLQGDERKKWCQSCGNYYEWMEAVADPPGITIFPKRQAGWYFDNDGWPEETNSHSTLRHRITRTVRSELGDFVHGKDIPPARLKFLVALLLDHHCELEGRLVRADKQLRPPRPPRPFPSPLRPLRKPLS